MLTPTLSDISYWKSEGIQSFSVSICIYCHQQLLLIRRSKQDSLPGTYEVPAGSIEDHEDPAIAIRRETYEETGIHVIHPEYRGYIDYYNLSVPIRNMVFVTHTVDTKVLLHLQEHDYFLWVAPNQVYEHHLNDRALKSIQLVLNTNMTV